MRNFELWYLLLALSLLLFVRCANVHLTVEWDDETACSAWHFGLRQNNGPIVL